MLKAPQSRACFAKFLSLSSRPLDVYYEGNKGNVDHGVLLPGAEFTINGNEGQYFFFTVVGNVEHVVKRVLLQSGKVLTIIN